MRQSDGSVGFVHGDGLPFGHEVVSAMEHAPAESTHDALAALQLAVHGLNQDPGSRVVRNEINAQYRNDRIVPVGKKVLNWLAHVDYPSLADFCVANSVQHATDSERLRRVEPGLYADTLERAERLRTVGYLPVRAAAIYEQAAEHVQAVRSMDFFEAGALQATAYYSYQSNILVHRGRYIPGTSLPTNRMQRAHLHELTHVSGDIAGGFMQIGTRGAGHRWLEEAFTSHTALVSEPESDAPAVINPAARSDSFDNTYELEREILHLITQEGSAPLQIGDISEAFFMPRAMAVKLRRHVFSRLGQSIAGLMPEYRESRLRGFSSDYEQAATERRSTAWLSRKVEQVWERLGLA